MPISKSFTGAFQSKNTNLFVELPFDVKAVFGKARPPVLVTVKSLTYPSTVAVYAGRSYLGLRRDRREAIGVKAGDVVKVTVQLDESERVVTAPPDLVAALKKNKSAATAWKALSFSHQREHVDAIEKAKKPETRARRIEKLVEQLTE